MDSQRNPVPQQQLVNSSLPMSNRANSPYAGRSRETSESSYDPTTVMVEPLVEAGHHESRKRKSTEPNALNQRRNNKRVRVGGQGQTVLKDASIQLPAEVWHHVFTLLPPPTLAKLLSVNKLFNNYLDPNSRVKAIRPHFPESPSSLTVRPGRPKSLHPMLPETIWRIARRIFLPNMPSPLRTKSELDSWRLATTKSCQFCRIRSREEAKDALRRGPGAKGVTPVFPLLILTCGPCLDANTLKEVDLLLSSSIPSVLLPALPAAFVTPEFDVVLPQTLQGGGGPPKEDITKIYSKEQVNALKAEFDGVKLLGSGAAEEWFKGLEARGKSLLVDASRWEKWESTGGLQRMRQLIVEAQKPPLIPRLEPTELHDRNGVKLESDASLSNVPLIGQTPAIEPANLTKRAAKRTKQEAMVLMKNRRKEIERRAALLVPPLAASVLAHMPSFQAAIQLTAPLDDDTWTVLAEKFLEQREGAEQEERKRLQRERASLTVGGEKGLSQTNGSTTVVQAVAMSRDPREVPDEEWDDVQGPVRAKISHYADEIIRDKWEDGDKVNKKSCPTFAAQVLLHVRKRFYTEVTKEQAAAATGQQPLTSDPPEGPWLQKLTLENMKWVFDVKVKPFTHKLRPELFLCHGCSNNKYFGLEGVIQHYAAKHTKALSLGNVVVFWRAEWPEVPPFMPDPKNPKVHTPQEQSQSKPLVTASAGLPARPALHQPASQTHHFPNAGPSPSQGSTYAAMPPAPHASNGHQHPHAALQIPQEGAQDLRGLTPRRQPDSRLSFMAVIARQTYDSLNRIDRLSSAVRLCVIIHHIAKDWQSHFNEAAPLLVFEEGISSNSDMEPLRRISGLRCKACSGSHSVDLQHTMYSALTLVNHFRQAHVESGPQPLDWRTEMVSLPALNMLYDLPRLLAHDGEAYQSVRDALPWAFAEPPPTAATYETQPPAGYHRQGTVVQRPANDSYGRVPDGQSYFGQEGKPPSLPRDTRDAMYYPPKNGHQGPNGFESPYQAQPPIPAHAQSRPLDDYHNEPAHRGWATPPSTAHYGMQYNREAPFFPSSYPQPSAQYPHNAPQAPEGEYEVVEARDPQTGALYHIRRRIERDPYHHYEGGAPQTHPYEDYRRAGTVAPPVRNEAEDYDPRYPAGLGPPGY